MASVQTMPTNPRFVNLTDRTYGDGRLTVLGYSHQRRTPKGAILHYWLCQCRCGNEKTILGTDLASGKTVSCRCVQRETVRRVRTTHGKTGTAEHRVWKGIIKRCYNPASALFHRYGGRDIRVCRRWQGKNGFQNFLADIGPRPTKQHQIDRRNNNLGYTPSNCRWATRKQQCRNKSNNRILTFRGRSMCLTDWSEHLGLPRTLLSSRLYSGWSVEKTLTTPRLRV